MFSQRISMSAFLPLLVVLLTVIASVAAHSDGASFRRHQRLHNRFEQRQRALGDIKLQQGDCGHDATAKIMRRTHERFCFK